MECSCPTYSINHHIPYWGMTFLAIHLATAWTNYAYSQTEKESTHNSLHLCQSQEIWMLQNQVMWLKQQTA